MITVARSNLQRSTKKSFFNKGGAEYFKNFKKLFPFVLFSCSLASVQTLVLQLKEECRQFRSCSKESWTVDLGLGIRSRVKSNYNKN